jgi:hypothetical protein
MTAPVKNLAVVETATIPSVLIDSRLAWSSFNNYNEKAEVLINTQRQADCFCGYRR